MQAWLREQAADIADVDFGGTAERLKTAVQSVTLRSVGREREWPLLTSRTDDPAFAASLDLFDRSSGRRIGAIEAKMRIDSLVPSNTVWTAAAGTVLGVIDPATGTSLLPLPFDAELIKLDRFEWSGEQWMTVRQRLH